MLHQERDAQRARPQPPSSTASGGPEPTAEEPSDLQLRSPDMRLEWGRMRTRIKELEEQTRRAVEQRQEREVVCEELDRQLRAAREQIRRVYRKLAAYLPEGQRDKLLLSGFGEAETLEYSQRHGERSDLLSEGDFTARSLQVPSLDSSPVRRTDASAANTLNASEWYDNDKPSASQELQQSPSFYQRRAIALQGNLDALQASYNELLRKCEGLQEGQAATIPLRADLRESKARIAELLEQRSQLEGMLDKSEALLQETNDCLRAARHDAQASQAELAEVSDQCRRAEDLRAMAERKLSEAKEQVQPTTPL